MREQTVELIKNYYDAFNNEDMNKFFSLLDENVIHDINQGHRETGKAAFQKFMTHMSKCYKESASNIVILTNDDGSRAAAEFIINGTYLVTDNGFLPANNQKYELPVGAFFEIKAGKIARVTNHYNVKEWVKLVSGE